MKYFYLSGKFLPPGQAKISIMTHAFNYGTAVFEGIRAYWNPVQKQLYLFRLKDHYKRMQTSSKALNLARPFDLDKMCAMTLKLLRKNRVKQNVYIRPICFQARLGIAAKKAGESGFGMFLLALKSSSQSPRPLRVLLSSWRRIDSKMIPSYGKLSGTYVNSFLAGQEASHSRFDEAIMLNLDGSVAEATGMNVFILKNKQVITPPLSANILPGITRDSIMKIAKPELGLKVLERSISKNELMSAEEVFLTGTGSEIVPVGSVNGKKIFDGKIGPVTKSLGSLYLGIVRGELARYANWLTPVY